MKVFFTLAVVMVIALVSEKVTANQTSASEADSKLEADTHGSKSKLKSAQSHQNPGEIKTPTFTDQSKLDRVAKGLVCGSGNENCGKIPIVNPNSNPPLRDPGAFPQSVGNTPVSSRPNSPKPNPKPTHGRARGN